MSAIDNLVDETPPAVVDDAGNAGDADAPPARGRLMSPTALRIAFDAALVPMLLLVVVGRFGRGDWLFDMTNFFRPHIAVLALGFVLLAVFADSRPRLVAAFVIFIVALYPLLVSSLPKAAAAPTSNLRVMSANVLGDNHEFDAFATRVAEYAPDILVAQEASPPWRNLMHRLPELVHVSDRSFETRVMVASRYPFTATEVQLEPLAQPGPSVGGGPPLRVEMLRPGAVRPLVIYAIHAPTTRESGGWFTRNAYLDQVARLAARDAERADVLVVGDWNTPIWSPALGRFLAQSGLATTERGAWPPPTRFFSEVGLPPALGTPIDRVAVSPDIRVASVRTGGEFGSDHLPIIVDLAIP